MDNCKDSIKRRDFLKIGATGILGACASGIALPKFAFADDLANTPTLHQSDIGSIQASIKVTDNTGNALIDAQLSMSDEGRLQLNGSLNTLSSDTQDSLIVQELSNTVVYNNTCAATLAGSLKITRTSYQEAGSFISEDWIDYLLRVLYEVSDDRQYIRILQGLAQFLPKTPDWFPFERSFMSAGHGVQAWQQDFGRDFGNVTLNQAIPFDWDIWYPEWQNVRCGVFAETRVLDPPPMAQAGLQ